ncbi:hypothetical protein BST20_17665 [Mycobacterium branderi]|uniref:Uncharacterized protein n=1 Tax=Mycobacterium branderi TaxID=43348 RepID=A0AA91LWK6_9MYCO|nr:hypothetical protein BST20_17665 [Mycobacterium branderi]
MEAVELTADQREFVAKSLRQWAPQWALSESGKPFPFQALGLSTGKELSQLALRLADAVEDGRPLTDLDWARALFLTECCWASSLIGLGPDCAAATGLSDADALSMLRRIQRKIGGAERANLLFPQHLPYPQG